MGGASGKIADKANNNNNNNNNNTTPMAPPRTQAISDDDPRSPSLKRTPLQTPENNWRHKAVLAAAAEDPRSPSLVNRTPLSTPPPHLIQSQDDPVTPLTVSYDQCGKINQDDPRSPSSFRTPLAKTQGVLQYDDATASAAVGPIIDDTVIVNKTDTSAQEELDITLSASSAIINNPLADMSIISSSTEVVEKPDQRTELIQSEADITVPSSPLGASAYKVDEEEEKKVESFSSPSLAGDRKRKQAPKHLSSQATSPLKKSYSSSTENDENSENTSPLIVPRRSTRSPTQSKPGSPTISKRKGHARKPSNLKNSSGGPHSPRSPLSPIVPHAHAAPTTALLL